MPLRPWTASPTSRAIAVTGGPADGKSTVLQALADLGAKTLSADHLAASLWQDSEWVSLVAEVLELPEPLTKVAVRQRITGDHEARRALNAVSHPLIFQQLSDGDVDAVEVPLLIEGVLMQNFSQVWVVQCGVVEQRRRLTLRLGNEAAADSLMATQLPTTCKIPFADTVIRTNVVLPDVLRAVRIAWERRGGLR